VGQEQIKRGGVLLIYGGRNLDDFGKKKNVSVLADELATYRAEKKRTLSVKAGKAKRGGQTV